MILRVKAVSREELGREGGELGAEFGEEREFEGSTLEIEKVEKLPVDDQKLFGVAKQITEIDVRKAFDRLCLKGFDVKVDETTQTGVVFTLAVEKVKDFCVSDDQFVELFVV